MKKIIFIAATTLFCLMACSINSPAEQNYSILILTNKGIKQYEMAVESFKQEVSDKGLNVSYTILDDNNPDTSKDALLTAVASKPSLILAVGTDKSLLAKDNIQNIPIVFTMVLDPVESGIVNNADSSQTNITGVSLKISIKDQFEKFKQIVPQLKSIGMMFDVNTKRDMRDEAEKAAQALGLKLVSKGIGLPSDVANVLDELVLEVDGLWAGVDPLIYNAQSSKYILLTTLRTKIPFMAFSSNYVKAGALMALESDYEDIGRQTADMAVKILKGQNPELIPVELPRKVKLLTNQNTAEVIGIKIPQDLLD